MAEVGTVEAVLDTPQVDAVKVVALHPQIDPVEDTVAIITPY